MKSCSPGRLPQALPRALPRDQRGAMMVMGIPMCLLMVGFLYFAIGLGEQIVMRERLQDAADAGAFSAAIMHARGMNMIALINQVMAAIVAVLVMVRLLQVLMIAVAAIGAALAFWTAGASLAVVPPATNAATQAENAFNQLKTATTPILRGLHVFELGLKYAMPVAAEARVIDTVAGHYNPPAYLGFAIPGHYPLPVVDGKWPDLCRKAGEYAGAMIAWPLDAIIGDNPVGDAIGDGVGEMAHTFSGFFCDSGSSAQGLSIPDHMPEIELDESFERGYPERQSTRDCNDPNADLEMDERDRVCEDAAIAEARGIQGDDGGPATTCAYEYGPGGGRSCPPCRTPDTTEACPEFMFKVEHAPEECRPGGDLEISSYDWQQRAFSLRANLVPIPLIPEGEDAELVIPDEEDLRYTIELTTEAPTYSDHKESTARPPCGEGGTLSSSMNASATYHADGVYAPSEMLCTEPHFEPDIPLLTSEAGEGTQGRTLREWRELFNDSRWTEHEEPYTPARPADVEEDVPWPPSWLSPPYVPEDRPFFVGNWRGATFLHGCKVTIESLDELEMPEVPDAGDTEQEAADPNSCGGGDMVHHDMETGHELGDETFQLRAVVFGYTDRDMAESLVQKMPLRRRGQGEGGRGFTQGAADLASRVFVAQAEYYFDTGYDEGRERTVDAPEEWLWTMGWRARLRRFRLPHDDEGGEEESSSSSGGGESNCNFEPPAMDVTESCNNAQTDSGGGGGEGESECPEGGGFLSDLQELAETVMVH